MPCLNSKKYLVNSIKSGLDQEECLELLIADGGSTDDSISTIQKWSAIDKHVRLISVKDNGPSDALNKAFNAARGIYIGWLNSDDLYLPNTL